MGVMEAWVDASRDSRGDGWRRRPVSRAGLKGGRAGLMLAFMLPGMALAQALLPGMQPAAGPASSREAATSTAGTGQGAALPPPSTGRGPAPEPAGLEAASASEAPPAVGQAALAGSLQAGDLRPFVLRVHDPQGKLGGANPLVELNNGTQIRTYEPQDQGQPPDVNAGDGIYSMGVADCPGNDFQLTLRSAQDPSKVLGTGLIAFDPEQGERAMAVGLLDRGIVVGTRDQEVTREAGAAASQAEANADAGGGPGRQPGFFSLSTFISFLFGLLGAFLGFRLALTWHHRWLNRELHQPARARFHPLGKALPGIEDGCSVWIAPPALVPGLARTLARALAQQGPVLLLPGGERGGLDAALEGALKVWIPQVQRPGGRLVLRLGQGLAREGGVPVLVVEGLDSLEVAHASRPQAAVEELIRAWRSPAFVVVSADGTVPEGAGRLVKLTAVAGGLQAEGGPLLRAHGEGFCLEGEET